MSSKYIPIRSLYTDENDKPKYEIDSFMNQLRIEMSNKTEIGNLIREKINQKTTLGKELEKRLWLKIFSKPRKKQILLINLNDLLSRIENLIGFKRQLNLKLKVLNFYLPINIVEQKAKTFARNHKHFDHIPDEEFIRKVINKEQQRITLVNKIKSEVDVKNIDSNCSENELRQKIENEVSNY